MAPGAPYRVMVVDDSAVIRALLTRSLESDPSIAVAASVPNGEIALRTLSRADFDVVVFDIEMPVLDGMTALPRMIEIKPDTRAIMASTSTRKNAEISLRALEAGAADYVTKPSSTGALDSTGDFKRELAEKIKALCSTQRQGTAGGSGRGAAAGLARVPVLGAAARDIRLRPAPSQWRVSAPPYCRSAKSHPTFASS